MKLKKILYMVLGCIGVALGALGGGPPYAPTLAELTKLLSVFFTFFNKSVFRQL